MRLWSYLATITAFAVALSAAFVVAPGGASAQDQQVDVGDFYFCDPAFENGVCDTTISAGDTVTWSVSGGFHTVTECDSTFNTCPTEAGFDSGQLTAGGQFQQTFDSAGTFYYRCNFHPNLMRGTISVQAAQETPTPTPAPTDAASPTPTSAGSVTPTPASAPSTGGAPAQGGSNSLTFALLGGLIAAAATVVVLRSVRQ